MIAPFVDVVWLTAHRTAVVVADVRWYLDGRSGREAYLAGHVPGAVLVDVDAVLAGPGSPAVGRHPLPPPDVFAAGLAALGIGDDTTVVAYDDDQGVIAARLVWLLRVTGHSAALLDGGLAAWTGPLEVGAVPATGADTRAADRFTARPWPVARLVSIDEVATTTANVLDARDPARYHGEIEPVDPRPGHIPGARNVPARANTDATGRLLPAQVLLEVLGDVGTDVISSCGSGVTACHTLLVLEQLGLGPGRLYPGSWSQWSADESRPAEF